MARPGLTGHRKFRRLSRILGSTILARGTLELLWDSCYESGEDYVGTADDIENLVGWTGEHGMLTRALVEAGAPEGHGFLEPASDAVGGAVAYRVHDLWHHAPDYVAKRRRRELERQEKEAPPKIERRSAPRGGQCSPTSDWLDGVERTPSPSPSPSPSPEGKNASAEASSAPFLEFPVIGPGPERWPLSEAQVAEWAVLYPGLDVRGEARKAFAWLQANAGRRKTVKGMARFLVSWLGRAVDSGRAASPRGVVASSPVSPQGQQTVHSMQQAAARMRSRS